ncbi:hypothetical protein GOP47_0027880 [Adiantum capillus-veneris]|nr:hypothetical protein GOP47_0027880 [Adiantum capillus-veneris]
MARPAYAERVQNKLAPLRIASFHEPAATPAGSAPFLLDALWHFECVVSTRSPTSGSPSPRSPAPASPRSHESSSSTCPSPSPLSRFAPSHQVLRAPSTRTATVASASTKSPASSTDSESPPPNTPFDPFWVVTKTQGHVEEDEFLQLYESVCSFVEEFDATASSSAVDVDDVDQDLLSAFHVFDKDRNGFISPSELQTVLCSLGFPQARQLDACVDMIARVDENGDGQVDFFEFKKLFHLENPFTPSIQSF